MFRCAAHSSEEKKSWREWHDSNTLVHFSVSGSLVLTAAFTIISDLTRGPFPLPPPQKGIGEMAWEKLLKVGKWLRLKWPLCQCCIRVLNMLKRQNGFSERSSKVMAFSSGSLKASLPPTFGLAFPTHKIYLPGVLVFVIKVWNSSMSCKPLLKCGWRLLDTSKTLGTEKSLLSGHSCLQSVSQQPMKGGWKLFTPEFEQYRLFYIKHTQFEREDVCTMVYRWRVGRWKKLYQVT